MASSRRRRTQIKKKRGKNGANNGAEKAEREAKDSNGRKAGIPPKTTPLTPTMNEGAGKKGRRRMATTSGAATTTTTTTTIGKAPRGEVGCQNEEEEEEMRRRKKEGDGGGKGERGWKRKKPVHSE